MPGVLECHQLGIGGVARLVAEDDAGVLAGVGGRVKADQVDGGIGQVATQGLKVATGVAVDLANRPEIRRLTSESAPSLPADRSELRRRVIDNAYSLPHVVGTCRMGPPTDVGAVVDHRGRVHGVDGLYVIDASIIPDAPAGFPHVITIMAAERISTQLAANA